MEEKRNAPEKLVQSFFEEILREWTKEGQASRVGFLYKNEPPGESGDSPWEHPGQASAMFLKLWSKQKDEIEAVFKKRNQAEISSAMKKGLALFLHYLFWSNGEPVSMDRPSSLGSLPIQPVNCEERIQFIIGNITLFHSFIQLCEMMDEQVKQFSKVQARKSIIKKRERQG